MSNKKILQGHNKALESLATIAGIPIKEKINPELFGCTKMAIDTFTPPNDIEVSTHVPHSLGELPKLAFIIGDVVDTSVNIPYPYVFVCSIEENGRTNVGCLHWYQRYIKPGYIGSSSQYITTNTYLTMTPTANVTSMSSKAKYAGGHTYTIITMA